MLNRHGKASFWVIAFLVLIILSILSWYVNKDFWIAAWDNVAGVGSKIKNTVSPKMEYEAVTIPKPPKPAAEPAPAEPQPAPQPAPEAAAAAPAVDKTSPVEILQSCVGKLKEGDLVGAEEFVSPTGIKAGIHKSIRKGLVEQHAYDEIGFKDAKINGQTAWIPVYTNLGAGKKMVNVYIIMANRGDGWKLDDIFDPKQP